MRKNRLLVDTSLVIFLDVQLFVQMQVNYEDIKSYILARNPTSVMFVGKDLALNTI